MGYLQTTNGITTIGHGATLSFSTPICPQLFLQVSGAGFPTTVILEGSLDGTNFIPITLGGGNGTQTNSQTWFPLAAIRYNVTQITGTASISIAAAPSGSQ